MDFPFVVGEQYTRADVFRVIRIQPMPVGGPWFTGYAAYGKDWFIFCNVGIAGRTGHDYNNHFDGDKLVWFAKTNTRVDQPSIQQLIHPSGGVYVFFREGDRDPFTFAGIGSAEKVVDETPVKIIWTFRGAQGARLPNRLSEEIDPEEAETVFEGARRTVQINVYERDPGARRKCIARWGTVCVVCNFDFGELSWSNEFAHSDGWKSVGQ